MVVGTACARTTGPAELVATKSAGHVVAACILFNLGPTRRAERHVVFVLFCPALKLLFHGLFTGYFVSVPLVTALETDIS